MIKNIHVFFGFMITFKDVYETAENNLSGFFRFSLLVPVKRFLMASGEIAPLFQEGLK